MTSNLTLGQVIKKLRKEKELTQEELAEQLMVSAQAVSKWENGSSMPDISQVVPIANFFGVTTDYLFGISDQDDRDEVRKALGEIYKIYDNCPDGEEGPTALVLFDKYREAIRKFPGNTDVLTEAMAFMSSIVIYYSNTVIPLIGEQGIEELVEEIEKYAELVIKYSNDLNSILSAKKRLIEINIKREKFKKALEIADTMPFGFDATSEYQKAYIYKESGQVEYELHTRCGMVFGFLHSLGNQSACIGNIYMDKGEYEKALYCYSFIRDTVRNMYQKEEYRPPFVYDIYPLYRFPAVCLMKLGKHSEAIDVLEEGVDFIIAQAEGYNVKKELDIPLLKGIYFSYGFDGNAKYNKNQTLKKLIFGNVFKPLEADSRFAALVERINSITE